MGADGITLNLNGHRIFGVPSQGEGVGIRIEGRHGVQVHGGRSIDFDARVAIIGGLGNVVRQMTVRNNKGSPRTEFGDGIAVSASTDNVIQNHDVVHNGPYDGVGLFANDGIRLFLQADRTLVRANHVFRNAANGIRVDSRSNRNMTGGNASASNPAPASDLHDTNTDPNPPCDANVWLRNTFHTAFPPCTTGGGAGSASRSAGAAPTVRDSARAGPVITLRLTDPAGDHW